MKQSLLLDRVASFMASVGSTPKAGIVAVSGGPDSVALLRLLLELHQRGSVAALVVAHLNHQLRRPDSDTDESFVQNLAKEYVLPFHSKRVDIAELARKLGENLESVARRVRYDWLAEIAVAEGVRWVATGHTADDQGETVLHRLVRGTGLQGLGGIHARRELVPGVEVIRPLLKIARADVLAYLQEISQPFCTDISNADVGFTRNRIRHELLPALATGFNSEIVSILCRLAEQANEVQSMVSVQVGELLKQTELPRAGNLLVFDRPRLLEAPRHLIREMFRLVWSRESWSAGAMTYDHWDRLAALTGQDGDIDLPGRIHARSTGKVIQVGR